MKLKDVTIQYRLATQKTKSQHTLEQRLKKAFVAAPKACDRLISTNGVEKYVINFKEEYPDCIFGDLAFYSKDLQQKVIKEVNTQEVFPERFAKAGNGEDFVQATTYWMVIRDHVFMLLPQHYTPSTLEAHISKFLTVNLADFTDQDRYLLEAISPTKGRIANLPGAKTLQIGLKAKSSDINQYQEGLTDPQTIREVLKLLIEKSTHDATRADKTLDKIDDHLSLKMKISLEYFGKIIDAGSDAINVFARNMPDEDLKISGKFGTVKADILRLSHKGKIEIDAVNKHPVRSSVQQLLREAYEELYKNNYID